MAKNRLFWLLLLCLSLATALQATAIEEFKAKTAKVESKEAALQLIREYLPKLSTAEDLRDLQNLWQQADAQACNAYFTEAAKKEPNNPVYTYLNLRFEQDEAVQFEAAKQLCIQHPDFYWGYRIFSVTYTKMLLNSEKDPQSPFKEDMANAAIAQEGIKLFPDDEFMLILQFHRYRLANKPEQADSYLLKIKNAGALNSNWGSISEYFIAQKKITILETLLPIILTDAIMRGQVAAEDSLKIFQQEYLRALNGMKDWEKTAAYYSQNPAQKENPDFASFYEDLLLKRDELSTLLDHLGTMMESNTIFYNDLLADDRYAPLKDNPRWKSLLAKAKSKWDADEPKRKAEALKERMNKPAPLWELPGLDGKLTKLSNLKGQVVVLDFWATWCSPCRKAMPALHRWMQKDMPQGVQVFSLNIWDKGDNAKATKYFSENGFAMTLLFAPDTIAADYGFNGVPYICVIDKKGNLAYSQSGYTDTLEENLSWWVQELCRE